MSGGEDEVRWVTQLEARLVPGRGTSKLIVLGNEAFEVNDVGASIWGLVDDRTTEEIAAEMAEIFDAPVADIRQDVIDFLSALEERKLIYPAP